MVQTKEGKSYEQLLLDRLDDNFDGGFYMFLADGEATDKPKKLIMKHYKRIKWSILTEGYGVDDNKNTN